MILVILGLVVYLLFFILIPGFGAISLRRRWSTFRNLLFKYSMVPALEYNNLVEGSSFSFCGLLESFKSDDIVWLKGESLSICINLKKLNIYTLSKNNDEVYKSQWRDISSLVEGTEFFVFGNLKYDGGVPYLVGSELEDLLVVVREGQGKIFDQLLAKGRDKNEMWNSYTPYAYITGVLILIILSYFSYKTSFNKINSFYLLLMAGTPFYFILPPGLFFYIKYRKSWDIALRYSVLSDLDRLKGRVERSSLFKKKSKVVEKLSLLLYVLGYLCNLIIAGIILFKLFQLIIFN
ncbi:hypothetical protein EW093_09955 [Thiospirochaeta perfilievii]|uniref:Uncharacterized protein n=1 Tax=Thiospirochaeta perfilievii TaxID=252967 RepID=A0A5C1QDF9_9SPIO|nr:hypothetical protein [Thiospirochaeta perfilievii]QEN05019.1 hypothetical protein EW093_09955 [Thiospirochaeta perfilievii]